jgi:hypothetical protein
MARRLSSTSSSSATVLARALVVTCAIAVVGDALVTSGILSGEISGAAKIGRIIHNDDPAESPIFGSSRAQCSLLPDIFAPAAFNYGIDGIGYRVVEFFLDKELRKARRTPIIVNFDYEWWHDRTGDLSYWIASSGDPDVKKILGDDLRLLHRVPLVRYYGRFDEYVGYALNERMTITKTTNRGGVFLVAPLTRAKFEEMVQVRLKTPLTYTVDRAMDERFRQRLMSRPDRQIVVVVAPYHWSYAKSIRNPEAVSHYLESLRSIPNVTVINRASVDYGDDHFMNTGHLNWIGAKRFSAELRSELAGLLSGAEHGGVTARRQGDPGGGR